MNEKLIINIIGALFILLTGLAITKIGNELKKRI